MQIQLSFVTEAGMSGGGSGRVRQEATVKMAHFQLVFAVVFGVFSTRLFSLALSLCLSLTLSLPSMG